MQKKAQRSVLSPNSKLCIVRIHEQPFDGAAFLPLDRFKGFHKTGKSYSRIEHVPDCDVLGIHSIVMGNCDVVGTQDVV